ncbi:MAG: carbamoyl transferase, partial [Chloroflexota bacterium]|nr:carbamoyl transferase [Chloroflexota bacterium]
RSILCDPRRPDMKDYLNARVKHREAFRPFAPTVLWSKANEWFEIDPGQPYSYMLSVVPVLPHRRDQIPAVLHVDDTARIQTVTHEENPGYWEIVNAFFQQTGVPMVLNTSFNLAGKPIVETPQDALTCFESTEIDVLALGRYLISKRPLAEYEADRLVLQH